MSHSSSLPEHSPDESGYFTSLPRRNRPTHEESDPTEESDAATRETSVESSVPAPPPTDVAGPSRGPRIMRTARKRVLPPRRVTIAAPSEPPSEPAGSQSRPRSVTPTPPAIGVPVPPPRGMTAAENFWVSGLSSRIQSHQLTLDHVQQSLDGVYTVLLTQDDLTTGIMEVTLETRRTNRRLYAYLFWAIGALVVMIGVLIWVMMR